jgi:hypothetical protein
MELEPNVAAMRKLLFIGATTVVAVAVWASPAEAADYQPDAKIKHGPGPYTGNDVYSDVPLDQEDGGTASPGDALRFRIRAQNDGTLNDKLIVHSGSHPAFKVRFFHGDANITQQVKGDGYKTRALSTGEQVTLRLRLEVRKDETGINGLVTTVHSRFGEPEAIDTVRARVEVV